MRRAQVLTIGRSCSRNQVGALRVAVRASTAWVPWAEDSAFGVRHDPRLVAFEGRRVVAGPVALGPRRSGDVPTVAYAATDCVSAWVGVPEEGDPPPILHAQVLDATGVPRRDERRIGPGATLSQLGSAAVARSIDERETLAVWTRYARPRGLLMAVRLGPTAPRSRRPSRSRSPDRLRERSSPAPSSRHSTVARDEPPAIAR